MKTMVTIITIILVIVWLFLLAGTTITFKPFSFSIPNWMNMVGWVLLILGITFLGVNENSNGFKKGYKEGSDDTIELVKQVNKEKPVETIVIPKKHE